MSDYEIDEQRMMMRMQADAIRNQERKKPQSDCWFMRLLLVAVVLHGINQAIELCFNVMRIWR